MATGHLDIVINEVAWKGTPASSSDEWIELYNNTTSSVSLSGWGLYEGGTEIEPLSGIIEGKSYYLVERTDDNTIRDIPADQTPTGWGGYGLSNAGEHLLLKDDKGVMIDEVDCSSGWFNTAEDYKTMERIDPKTSGNDLSNWHSNNGIVICGLDAESNPINGTPKFLNSPPDENSEEETDNQADTEDTTDNLNSKERF